MRYLTGLEDVSDSLPLLAVVGVLDNLGEAFGQLDLLMQQTGVDWAAADVMAGIAVGLLAVGVAGYQRRTCAGERPRHDHGHPDDVQPFLAIVLGLRAAGHDAVLVTPHRYAALPPRTARNGRWRPATGRGRRPATRVI